eukprot:Skav214006  [mRNA]  locus=scaffold1070:219128:227038:- [translate_table: standard]
MLGVPQELQNLLDRVLTDLDAEVIKSPHAFSGSSAVLALRLGTGIRRDPCFESDAASSRELMRGTDLHSDAERIEEARGHIRREPRLRADDASVLESLCGADRTAVADLHQTLLAEVHTRERPASKEALPRQEALRLQALSMSRALGVRDMRFPAPVATRHGRARFVAASSMGGRPICRPRFLDLI